MSRWSSVAIALALVLAGSSLALAQEQGGSIQGAVRDSSGGVLPGVTVEARTPSAPGINSAVTDHAGVYRFPALPPGAYGITATLAGFKVAKIEDAILVVGKSLTVDFKLEIATVSENVTVTGESPIIDTRQNATFATLQRDTIDRIPRGRDFSSILKQAPGAQDESKSGGIQIDGASGSENRWIVDGMDTTNLRTGVSGKTIQLDFVDEVQVKSSGYNAEFGGSTGGVVSVITKSGGNSLKGSAGSYFSSSTMWGMGDRRPSNRYNPTTTSIAEKSLLSPIVPSATWSPVFDLGGPVMKDKLWYYAGFNFNKQNDNEDITFFGDPARLKRHFETRDYRKYGNYKATAQLSNNVRVTFAGSNQRNEQRGSMPGFEPDNALNLSDGTPSIGMTTSTFDKNADGSINQTAFDNRWIRQGSNDVNDTYAGNVDWVINQNFFVSVQSGLFKTDHTTPEEFRGTAIRHIFSNSNSDATMLAAGMSLVPAQFQFVNNYTDNISTSGTARDKYDREFVNANATLFKSWKGQHTFKVGMRFERFGNDVLTGNTKPNVNLYWGQRYTAGTTGQTMAGAYGYYVVSQQSTLGNVHSDNTSLWVQDGWNVNGRLTLNYGLRAENEYVPSYKVAPDAIDIKFSFKDKIAPRLGFAYDVRGDSRWKAYGSWGVFYENMYLELPRGSFGGDHWINYYWTLNDPDFSKIQCGEGTTGCPGTFIEAVDFRHSSNQIDPLFESYFNRPNMTGIDPNLKPVRGEEFTTGVDHELNATMSLGLRYVHKWLDRTIEDTGIWVNGVEDYLIANPGESLAVSMEPKFPAFQEAKPMRHYDSVELRLNRRMSQNWSGTASYLWSRLYGNYSGLASSDEQGRTSPSVNRYYDNQIMNYDDNAQSVFGVLPTDRPHTFKLTGTYDLRWLTRLSTNIGAYFVAESGTPQTSVMRFTNYPVFPFGRDDLGRSPWLSQTDLALTQEVRVGQHRGMVQLFVDNLFDQMTWLNYFQISSYGPSPYRDSLTLTMPPAVLYAPYNLNNIVSGYTGTMRPNVFYTTPNSFQGRRSLRALFKFQF